MEIDIIANTGDLVWKTSDFGDAPDGRVDRVVGIPVNFGTTAELPLPQSPGGPVFRGSLFALSGLGVQGVPELKFGA
jgi:L-arabinonolactonase